MKDIILNTLAGLFCTACSNAQEAVSTGTFEDATLFECKYFDEEYSLSKDRISYFRKGNEYLKTRRESYDMLPECYEFFLRKLKEGNVRCDASAEPVSKNDFYRFSMDAYKGRKKIFSAVGNNKNEGTCKYEGNMPTRIFGTVLEYCSNENAKPAPTGKLIHYESMSGAWENPDPDYKYVVDAVNDKECKVTVIDGHLKIYSEKTFKCPASLLDDINKVVLDHMMYLYHSSYQPEMQVCDGYRWDLSVKYDDGGSFRSGGSNAGSSDDGVEVIREMIREVIQTLTPDISR